MLIDICSLLRLLRYSPEFVDNYVLALTALFFGTGNQTRSVPAAVMARVFCDPEFAIFRLDPTRFVGKSTDFFAFSSLRTIYETMKTGMEKSGVEFLLGSGAKSVERNANRCKVTLTNGKIIQVCLKTKKMIIMIIFLLCSVIELFLHVPLLLLCLFLEIKLLGARYKKQKGNL